MDEPLSLEDVESNRRRGDYHLIPGDKRTQMTFDKYCFYLAEISGSLLHATEIESKIAPSAPTKRIFLTTQDASLVTKVNEGLKKTYPNHWYVATGRDHLYELVKC